MDSLKITTFQAYLFWENCEKNLQNLALRLSAIREKTDLIVLPEMFNTGFSMNTEKLAEEMGGTTMQWMQQQARKYEAVVTGSLIIKENDCFYNRLIWMRPDGTFEHYDKRHLFSLANEDDQFTPGNRKFYIDLHGWKICPAICYDLRFPVWSRNTLVGGEPAYDVLLYVAHWPEVFGHPLDQDLVSAFKTFEVQFSDDLFTFIGGNVSLFVFSPHALKPIKCIAKRGLGNEAPPFLDEIAGNGFVSSCFYDRWK